MTRDQVYARIASELALLGDFADTRADLVADALTELLQATEPLISASLAVTAGTKEYTIPATIDIIERLEDSADASVAYALNREEGSIALQDDPVTGTLTMYGVPADPRTNCDAIITGLDEKYLSCLWQYVRAAIYASVNDQRAELEYTKAEAKAHRLNQYKNDHPAMSAQAIQIKDAQGNIIGDSGGADGINVAFGTMGQADEY